MKALSLTQPWASLVAAGMKRVETRSWRVHYRGPVAIHAAASFPSQAREICATGHFAEALCDLLPLPTGAVVAIVSLRGCRTTEGIVGELDERELAFGDYAPGRWAWLLADVAPLPHPIAAKGSRGLWEWTPPPDQPLLEHGWVQTSMV